jgi:hypothetical protein
MTKERRRFPIGISDFRKMREGSYHYVDKSRMIAEMLTDGAEVLLLPRPRRFGKTLNLSMLRYFFEKSAAERRPLFAGLDVERSEAAWPHFQRYPVIFLTFKDVKPTSWDECFERIAGVLGTLYGEHRYLLEGGELASEDAERFTAVLHRRASRAVCTEALGFLSRLLAAHHGEKVVILVDEYDSPIHAGFTHRYYDDVIAFFRDFLSAGLKDNDSLFKGFLTGILRVAKETSRTASAPLRTPLRNAELRLRGPDSVLPVAPSESLFSGLNNVEVFGILRSEFATSFGFTEPEVRGLLEAIGHEELLADIRSFYNGYLFGGEPIYNPWSVLSYLSRETKELLPYWIDTSGNELVRELLLTGPAGLRVELEALLGGGTIDKPVEENIVLRDILVSADAVWSFLLFTGYLKPVQLSLVDGVRWAKLAVPNFEVTIALRRMVQDWLANQIGGSDELREMLAALLRGDGPVVERRLSHLAKVNVSYFDTAGPEPERFYHGLVVGILAGLGSPYEVRSNRESGFGRCDVMVVPRAAGQPGVVLELKRVKVEEGESVETALGAALQQIRERDYAAELRERGAAPIHEIAAVFDGKRAYVRVAPADRSPD